MSRSPWPLASALCVAAAFLSLLAIFAPGVLHLDGLYLIKQIRGAEPVSDMHPPLYTLLLWPWVSGRIHLTSFLATQVLCVAAAVYRAGRVLDRVLHGRWWTILAPALWLVSIPVIGWYSIAVYGDTLYATCVLLLTVELAAVAFSPQGTQAGLPWRLVAIALAAGLLRHNGVAAALAAVALGAWLTGRRWRRTAGWVLASAALIFATQTVLGLAVVRERYGAAQLVLPHHLAAHLDAGHVTEAADRALLEELRPIEDGWTYRCETINTTLWRGNFHLERAREIGRELWRLWARLALRFPATEVKHQVCVSELVWNPARFGWDALPISWEDGRLRWVSANRFGLRESGRLAGLQVRIEKLHAALATGLLARPALFLYLSLVTLIVAPRIDRRRMLVLLGPLWAHSVFLALGNVGQAIRYQLPVYYATPFLLAIALARRWPARTA